MKKSRKLAWVVLGVMVACVCVFRYPIWYRVAFSRGPVIPKESRDFKHQFPPKAHTVQFCEIRAEWLRDLVGGPSGFVIFRDKSGHEVLREVPYGQALPGFRHPRWKATAMATRRETLVLLGVLVLTCAVVGLAMWGDVRWRAALDAQK